MQKILKKNFATCFFFLFCKKEYKRNAYEIKYEKIKTSRRNCREW